MGLNVNNYNLSADEFSAIRDMVYNSIGVNLTEAKKALVISRLSGRLRTLKMASFSDYLVYLKKNPGELDIMFNCITTNVTHFFREDHHFKYFTEVYFPTLEELSAEGKARKKIRIWSAGCSTGEEPYSIAIVLQEYFCHKNGWDIKILASDINTEALEKAKAGKYSVKEIEAIPYSLLKKYFKIGTGPNKGYFKVKEPLQNLIDFEQINLTSSDKYPVKDSFNIIFCRNVFIYFDHETQKKILDRYHSHLIPDGLLLLGHSETINANTGSERKWLLQKHTIYKRV